MQIGIDESGLGAIAGPLVVAIAALQEDLKLDGIRDSKKLRHGRILHLADKIKAAASFCQVEVIPAVDIDTLGIYKCWSRAVQKLARAAHRKYEDEIILDGNKTVGISYVRPEVRADTTFVAVAAASILAKSAQLQAMHELHSKYPKYQFIKHNGYGTTLHVQLLEEYGPCQEHRKSFQPVRTLLQRCG